MFITAACVSLEIARSQVLNRGLHLDLEVLPRSNLDESLGSLTETKNDPQPDVCASSLADSYSSSQESTALRN